MISEYQFLKLSDGVELQCNAFERGMDKWLIVTHGIAEHHARHYYLNDLFPDFNLFFYDLRGHGRSGGERGSIDNFGQFYDDLKEVIQFSQSQFRMKKYALYGHSMGSLITAGTMQRYASKIDVKPSIVFLSGPPVGFGGPVGKLANVLNKTVLPYLRYIPYSVALPGLVDLKYLSHKKGVREDYERDPLCQLKLQTKLLLEMANAARDVFSRPLRLPCPGVVAYGSEDQVISIEMLKDYFSEVEKEFEIKEFKGAYHEIHNEIEKCQAPYFKFLQDKINSSF